MLTLLLSLLMFFQTADLWYNIYGNSVTFRNCFKLEDQSRIPRDREFLIYYRAIIFFSVMI